MFFWIVLALLIATVHSKKRKPDIVSTDKDADDAINTLIGLGFSREDAETRVFEARRNSQDADFQTLIDLAVKNR